MSKTNNMTSYLITNQSAFRSASAKWNSEGETIETTSIATGHSNFWFLIVSVSSGAAETANGGGFTMAQVIQHKNSMTEKLRMRFVVTRSTKSVSCSNRLMCIVNFCLKTKEFTFLLEAPQFLIPVADQVLERVIFEWILVNCMVRRNVEDALQCLRCEISQKTVLGDVVKVGNGDES